MDLSKRGKVGDVYRSGSFKKAKKRGMKTADLTKAQLKRATTARGKKVSQKAVKRATAKRNETDISQTQFEKGKGVTKNGRLFTGTVKLASGKTATYVRGRRVVAGPKKTGGGGGGGGAGGGGGRNIPTTRVTPSQRQEGAGGRPASTTYSGRTNDAAKARGLGRSSARSQGRNTAGRRAGERMTYRQKTPSGTFLITMEWDGTRWTQARKQRVSG